MLWLNIILQVQVDIYVKINSEQVLKILKEYKRQEINQFKITKYKSSWLTAQYEFIKFTCHNLDK